jgi:hypothetical protein
MKHIKMLTLALLLCTAATTHAQNKPIADETTVRASGKSNFAVVTTNDKIFNLVITKFEPIMLRYTVTYKIDRLGRYKEMTVYFKLEDEQAVETYIKSL